MTGKYFEYCNRIEKYCDEHKCGDDCALNLWCESCNIYGCNFIEAIDAIALIDYKSGSKPKDIYDYDYLVQGSCPQCGKMVELEDNYCRKCGTKLNWGSYK